MQITSDSAAFLNAVVNPFGAVSTARVTDVFAGNSVCLTDWLDLQPTILGTTLIAYTGVAYMFLPGYSNLKSTYSDSSAQIYQLVSIPILTTGLIGLTAGSKISSLIEYTNYATITGNAASFDADDCLVDAFRIFSAGIRAWPTTEVVTDTSLVHVTRYYGGLISANSVFRSIVDGTNFINIMKNTDSIKMYPGYEGVTVRYNPFQTPEHILDMKSLTNWNMQAHDFSGVDCPIIMAQFSASITGTTASALSYVNSRVWIEGQLSLPTPIYSNGSPLDLNFPTIRQVMSRPSEKHPFVSGGHTFEAFAMAAGGLAATLDLAAYAVDSFGALAANMAAGSQQRTSIRRRNMQPRQPRQPRRKNKNKKVKQPRKVWRPKQIIRPAYQAKVLKVKNVK
jgi:hypothetical protein